MKEIKLITEEDLTEEEREQMVRQQYLHQREMLEIVSTFILMGYETSDIYSAMRSLKFYVSEDQVDFYCGFIKDRRDRHIYETNDELWRFLWQIEPPEIPEPEQEPKKDYHTEAVSSYMCRIVVLNLLIDRIDYLKSVLRANCFEMTHFINAGYDTKYVETMKTAIEENSEKHSRDIARRVYHTLYIDAKHMEGYIYPIDKRDFWSMIDVCRREWKNRRELVEGGQRDE